MRPGYDGTLFVLAFDHRGSFQKAFFGVTGDPTPEDTERIVDAKRLIFEGFQRALAQGAPAPGAGVLVDEQFGAGVAHDARSQGVTLAMPVERSGQNEFDFEYGEEFASHVEAFDPTFSKVLVRFNPEGDGAMNARQAARLQRLGEWLHAHDRKFLFELLVPAEPLQLETVGGDPGRYDRELRPDLMRVAIAELQESGVEPDVWKIEGIDRPEDCAAIAEQTRTAGREDVKCVVLGRGADAAAVDRWLRAASGVPGYAGFAIGRTIWWEPLRSFVDGTAERSAASQAIADNYRRFIAVYQSGAPAPS
jgi:myo-inositol catabolism protein IolC